MKNLLLVGIILFNLGLVSCDQNSACLDKDYNNKHAITTSKNNLNASCIDDEEDTNDIQGNTNTVIKIKKPRLNIKWYTTSITINDKEFNTSLGRMRVANFSHNQKPFLFNTLTLIENQDTEGTALKNEFLNWANENNLKKEIIYMTSKKNEWNSKTGKEHFLYTTTIQWSRHTIIKDNSKKNNVKI